MQYIETSTKSVQEVVNTIKQIAPKYKFGVLNVSNMKETLNSKGFDFKEECQIIDICNPSIANDFLSADIAIACVLPCKITVYTQDNETMIILNSLVQLVDDVNPDLVEVAQNAQEELLKIIDEAK